jgi:H+/gluconate symporter-like permease
MSIALNILGERYLEMAQATGINPQALHRVAAIACGSLDTLPHNGAVITLLAICGLSHRESYADIGMVAVVIPLLATIAAVILGSFGVV